ncbi:TlpA family protein disulfide reductase [Algoriphagus boritolerans]|uniref:TlpA family protein disulfide reductase n=1 Tax=Algoriphagus boritolerans TaxID=308111 RepID=UPI000ADA8665
MVVFLTCFSGFLFATDNPTSPSQFPIKDLIGIDGEPFSTRDVLDKGKTTIVFYLSPECGACAEQTKAITSNMDQMEDVQFLFVTAYEPESTKAFLEDHHIGNFPNIRFGYDINLTLQQHYQLYAVPSSTCTIPMDNLAMNGRAIHLWKCSKTRWMGK